MTILCIKPFGAWWSDITQSPTTGPEYGETCYGSQADGGYVLEGYGEEPYDEQWFIPIEMEKKGEEVKECLNV